MTTRRVGVIGCGAIGRAVCQAIADGRVAGAELVAVVDNRTVVDTPAPQLRVAEAIEACDVLVECAGQPVVAQYAEIILTSGTDLLVTSVGALADPELAERVLASGPGHLMFTAGAVGGIDMLSNVAAQGPITSARVTSTKLPSTLVQPWMDEEAQQRLSAATEPVEVFRGSAREAARCFPRSLNVAATVAFALGSFEAVEVQLIADPAAPLTRHLIEVESSAGSYRFEFANKPSPENPRTSGVVAQSVLRTLSVLVGNPLRIV